MLGGRSFEGVWTVSVLIPESGLYIYTVCRALRHMFLAVLGLMAWFVVVYLELQAIQLVDEPA